MSPAGKIRGNFTITPEPGTFGLTGVILAFAALMIRLAHQKPALLSSAGLIDEWKGRVLGRCGGTMQGIEIRPLERPDSIVAAVRSVARQLP